jgi:hypothetical protein
MKNKMLFIHDTSTFEIKRGALQSYPYALGRAKGFGKHDENYFEKENIFGISTAVQLLSLAFGERQWTIQGISSSSEKSSMAAT